MTDQMTDPGANARQQLRSIVERIEQMNEEQWLPIRGFPSYEVSDHGRVKSSKGGKPKILKGGPGTTSMGYRRVTLMTKAGKRVCRNIHSLVAETFICKRPAGKLALHRDGDVNNCRLSNIYWGSYQDNANDRILHGKSGKYEENPNAKLSADDVSSIRSSYSTGRVTQTQLASLFGVTQPHISLIIRGVSWPQEVQP